ncbi:hypothetical protein [Dickeya solani]|uniref:hypothetical protein n=1 Tax=Dickeya solani TaxID=1089444 RepID=UPI0008FBDA7A|nr:hypothetical protein [Dickeya solani]MBJ2332861.1 hypothetical protein [Dickeya solani]MBJ2338855.1 hypothetical protein [Dickeya solani]MBJ2341745.1 hypothetical protein [Dickeya solani]MBJ2352730.1 hypothetical protein [Dickeya solani]MCZ0785618.1 hypothetical protein [Dickeya solani]
MASLDLYMGNYYDFTSDEIDRVVPNTAGNYALGYISGNQFIVRYVGRSDSDVNQRLKSHIGKHPLCTHFKFSTASSPKAAFEKECQNWHDFNPPENQIHPDRASNSKNWKCPRCNVFDEK